MKDEGLVANGKTTAEKAVSYLLQRIARDADLRYLMLGTEAYRLLCDAEKERTGVEIGGPCAIDPPPNTVNGQSRLACWRELVDCLESVESEFVLFTSYRMGELRGQIKDALRKAQAVSR